MLNGLHLYITIMITQSAWHWPLFYLLTHQSVAAAILGTSCPIRSNLGLSVLLKDTMREWIGISTANPLVIEQPALPLDPQSPWLCPWVHTEDRRNTSRRSLQLIWLSIFFTFRTHCIVFCNERGDSYWKYFFPMRIPSKATRERLFVFFHRMPTHAKMNYSDCIEKSLSFPFMFSYLIGSWKPLPSAACETRPVICIILDLASLLWKTQR